MWRCIFCRVRSESSFKKRQWRKNIEVQTMWLFILLHRLFEVAYENPHWGKCNQCEYASSHADSLRTHLKTHSGEKPWKCSQCDFASSYSHHLRLHLKSHIDGEKTNKWRDIWMFILEEIYINVICVIMQPHKQFTLKHIWKHTAERNHTNVPSVSMHPLIYAIWGNICTVGAKNRAYATNVSLPRTLMIHMRIHSGGKPNKCSQCNYTSHQEGNLKSHLKTHSGEKDYKCDKCNYKAARAEHLKSHMKRHTRLYKCNCCTDAFNLENDLRSHLKTHIDGQLPSNLQRQTQLGQSKVTLSNLIEVQKHLAEIST